MADRMTTTPVTVPAGFVLVPEEATPEMLKAADGWTDLVMGDGGDAETRRNEFRVAWNSMIAARPAITAGTDAGEEGIDPADAELQEIQDGSWGDGPAMRGWARDELARRAGRRSAAAALTPETAEAVPVAAQSGEAVRGALQAAVRLIIQDASWHLRKYRPHCLAALEAALEAALASVPAPAGEVVEPVAYVMTREGRPQFHLVFPNRGMAEKHARENHASGISESEGGMPVLALCILSQPKEPRT